jgi:HTH-type transcriptional regulator, cell division transcriptional repressor
MSNQKEKLLFSERLKKALSNADYPISPTFLSNEFNHRYDGQAISVQSANNWLLGKAIPNQDKLAILSIWLNVSSQWLRFGDSDAIHSTQVVLEKANDVDLDFFLKFKKLPQQQKQILKLLLDEFTKP